MSPSPLSSLLASLVQQIWPRRLDQEFLFDLGEHKPWTRCDFDLAVRDAAAWLEGALLLRPQDSCSPTTTAGLAVVESLRSVADRLPAAEPVPGVGRWFVALAPALGTSPKTLSNSLRDRFRPDRRVYRWASAILRIRNGDGAPDAWAYHRRSPASVSVEMQRRATRSDLDAGDALLLLSLLGLWQRRRPTEDVRANRRRPGSRRSSAKPIAGLLHDLVEPGQVGPLVQVARVLAEDGLENGRSLALLTVEAALTEAHLAPHPSRRSTRPQTSSGEPWLRAVEAALAATDLFENGDRAVLRFRVARMRAWRDKVPHPPAPEGSSDSPYVAASLFLERLRGGERVEISLDPHAPGLMMLLPLLRGRATLEGP